MHLTFQNPMQYLLYLLDFLSAPDTFKAERHSCFGPATSFLLQLSVIDLHSSVVVYWTPSNLGGHLFAFLCCPWGSRGKNTVQFSSIAQLCPTLCDPMNCSTPGLPVHHQLPEFTQTHVHQVADAIQPSHPLLSPSLPAPNPSQHQSLFQ